jgi:hypothetical protein
MKVARGFLPFLITLVLWLAAAPAAAESHASLGVNFSIVGLSTETETSTLASVPNDVLFGLQPGLRLGFPGESGMDDFYFDTGFVVLESSSLWSLTLNYQRNLAHSATAPYLTVGGGFRTESTDGGGGDTGTLLGGGFGVIHRLADDHGTLRLELRLDVLNDPNLSSTLKSFGVKAGFDVWVR